MRRKQKNRQKRGLALILAVTMTVSAFSGNLVGSTVLLQAAEGDIQPSETEAETPVITAQPEDMVAVYGYQNKMIKIQVAEDLSNYTYSYQWYTNTVDNNSGGTLISGATSERLLIPEGLSAGNTYYYCVVEAKRIDNQKISSVSSKTAIFTVTTAERTIVINSLDKTFDKEAVESPVYKVFDKEGNEITTLEGTAGISYYKDSNGSLGNQLSSAPSEPGTYWVQITISARANYKAVSEKRKFEISYLETPEIPYTLEVEGGLSKKEWHNKDVTIKPAQGYKIAENSYHDTFKESITVSSEGEQQISIYLQSIESSTNNQITNKISVPIKIDMTNPTGSIQVSTNSWKKFLENITFGIFFKNTQNVVITGEDEASGVGAVSYFISSDVLTEEQAAASKEWTGYSGNLSLNPEDNYIVYARITDKAGNVSYLCSDGMVFDNTRPVVKGVESNKSYFGEITFEVEDAYLKSVRFDNIDLKERLKSVNNTCIISNGNNIETCEITLKEIQNNTTYIYTAKAIGNDRHNIQTEDQAGNSGNTVMYFGLYKKYTVTYEYMDDSGTIQQFKTQEANFDDLVIEPSTKPQRTGYVFLGWLDKNTGKEFDFSTKIIEDLTLTAKWEKAVYQVSFDSQGGSVCNDINVSYETAFGTIKEPSRAGYEFQGWYTSALAADADAPVLTEYDGSISQHGKITRDTIVKFTKNIVLYARWIESNYKVRFEAEGGTIKALEQTSGNINNYDSTNHVLTVTYNRTYGDLPEASKPGYVFLGWYTDKNSGNKIEASTVYKAAGDTTVYAHWREGNFQVTLNYNYTGHTPSTVQQPLDTKIAVTYNSTYHTLPENDPIRPGYTFLGWYTQPIGGREITVDTKVTIEEDTTFYAQWKENTYSLSFNADGGSTCVSKTVTYGQPYGVLPVTTKTGYIFTGWYLPSVGNAAEVKVKDTDKVEITENTVLIAKWEACKFEVTLDANNGKLIADDGTEIEQTKIEVIYNATYASCGLDSKVPTKIGYDFLGWYTEAENGTEVKGTNKVKITSNTTLYAHWIAKVYTVAFHADTGETIIPPDNISTDIYDSLNHELTVTYDKQYNVLPTAEKIGYDFAGWYTDRDANAGIEVKETDKVEITSNLSLYAHWTPKEYIITLNPNGGKLIGSDGTAIPSTISVIYKDTYHNLAGKIPTRTGYDFAGWYTKSDNTADSVRIESSDTVEITDKKTLYAHWTPAALLFTGGKLEDAVYEQAYQASLGKPVGGTGSYRYSLESGSSLPAGLELVGNIIQGTWKENITSSKVTFTVVATDQNSGAEQKAEFYINVQKGEQTKPSRPEVLERRSNSITLKKIDGMEYCKMDSGNTDLEHADWTGDTKFTGLLVGTAYDFYTRRAGTTNYNPSSVSDVITVFTRNIYTITLPDDKAQTDGHYKVLQVSADNRIEEGGSYTFQIELSKGYSKTGSFIVAAEGANGKREQAIENIDGSYTIRNIKEDKNIIVQGVGDITYPKGTITITGKEGGSWNSFTREITFSRFFSTVPSVAITGVDEESGIASISHYIAGEKEVWDEYRVNTANISWINGINVDLSGKEGKIIIYVKIEDKAGNITYLRSDGIVIDTKMPEITVITEDGITKKMADGDIYTTTVKKDGFFTVLENNLKSVTRDMVDVYAIGGKYTIPADNKKHTMQAVDKAGNTINISVQLNIQSYTINFLSDGSIIDTKTVYHNQTIPIPTEPTKAGYIFYGWYQGEKLFDFNTVVTDDMELEAKWVETGSSSVSKPIVKEISETRVVLQKEEGCKYRINWEEATEATIFTGLIPGKKYYFYKINEKGEVSEPLEVTTSDMVRCGMTALPSTLYQGEAYEIEPTIAMAGLVSGSVDPTNTYIVWRVNRPDIVDISQESIKGCTLSINNVPYNKNRLTKVTLTATVGYMQLRNGEAIQRTREYRKSFYVQNLSSTISFDFSNISVEPMETGAFISGSAICLMDKKGVTLKASINQGMEENIATNQKLKWFISDQDGKSNSKGKKIASVSSKGVLKGIRPGKTYVTVAAADSYNKATKSYNVFTTYEVVCPWVKNVVFDTNTELTVKVNDTVDLSSLVQYNPENIFNQLKMKIKWKSSDTGIARVTQKGKVTFRKAGTVTITCIPTGGQEIDAATGRISDNAKEVETEITFTVEP